MTRLIKFRAKRTPDGKWITGDLSHALKVTPDADIPVLRVDGYDVDPDTIGQFTGLTDLNGTELYEGDIVSMRRYNINSLTGHAEKRNYRCAIVWDQTNAAWCRRDKNGKISPLGRLTRENTKRGIIYHHDFRIVGNIHDTPDMLQTPQTVHNDQLEEA